MSIESIRVKNFRSLREVNFEVRALTVFVGANDEGKSNLLRALDLFFNNDRRNGYNFNWNEDFCAFAKTPKNKAPQIDIAITFKLPKFNLKTDVVWKKSWRQSGFYEEIIKLSNNEELPKRSKVYAYLKSIRYNYVPAIKGPEYFQRLLASVHDMLDETVRYDIRNAADSFTSQIRTHTQDILSDLEDQLNLKSEIQLPSDLRQLFSDLEFRSDAGGYQVALSQRGDGIKVRHIPVILRWLAKQANHLSAPGKPRTETIWGYEEPENNLEIKKCFELSHFFIESSNSVQTFLTTHSPVFYSVFYQSDADVKVFQVSQKSDQGTFLIKRSQNDRNDIEILNTSLGFLELLQPHVLDLKQKIDKLNYLISKGFDFGNPAIFVEGPSDKVIIEAVLKNNYIDKGVKVYCSLESGGGHAWVKDSLLAWHYSRPEYKAIGVFDNDIGGRNSLNEFRDILGKNVKNPSALAHQLKPNGHILNLNKMGIKVPLAIEEMCPIDVWIHANNMGWLENRSNLIKEYDFNEVEITFNDWLDQKISEKNYKLIATKKVAKTKKKKFSEYIAKQISNKVDMDFKIIFDLVDELVGKIDA